MFRTDLLSIIRSLNTVFTAIVICHTEILKIGKIFYQNKVKKSASCWLLLYGCCCRWICYNKTCVSTDCVVIAPKYWFRKYSYTLFAPVGR